MLKPEGSQTRRKDTSGWQLLCTPSVFPPYLQLLYQPHSVLIFNILSFLFTEWSVANMKEWVIQTFPSKDIAQKFEDKELDKRILLLLTVRSKEAMENLGVNTLGRRGKLLKTANELVHCHFRVLSVFQLCVKTTLSK